MAATGTRDTLRVAMPEGITAQDSGLNQFVRNLALEGLTQLAQDGRVVPWLAREWRWEDNNLTLRVSLPSNTTFHDGTSLDAALGARILSTLITPGNISRYPSLAAVRSVEPSGTQDLLLRLSEPNSFLPEDLEMPLEIGTRQAPIGTGAFRIVSAKDGVVLDRFEHYRNGPPQIAHVIVKPVATLRNAWTSLLRGDDDVVTDVPPDAVEFVSNSDVQVMSFARRYQYLIAFNEKREPFRSPAVRRALNLAIDRASLVQRVLKGQGTPSTGPLWPKYWAYDASIQPFDFDQHGAQELLDAAGLRMHATPTAGEKPPSRFRFTCLIPSNFTMWERLALEVQKSLYAIGVDMEFKVLPFGEFNTAIAEGNFDAVILDMISGPTPGRMFLFWRSARDFRGLNVFGYDNPDVDRLYDMLRTTSNEAAVRSATRRLQRVFLDDPPALFMAWSERARAVRRDFTVPAEPGRDPLQTLPRWTPGAPLVAAR